MAALSLWYVEPLRFTPRRIRRGTCVNAAELVRRQCPAKAPLADFFSILLEPIVQQKKRRPIDRMLEIRILHHFQLGLSKGHGF